MYVQTDTLLLANVFKNFTNMCLKIYELEFVTFLSAPGLASVAALKKTYGGICNSIYWYAKANDKYMKDYDKNKKSSYPQYWDVNNLHEWAISQKLKVNNFEWVKYTSKFKEDFIKKYNEESDEGYNKNWKNRKPCS